MDDSVRTYYSVEMIRDFRPPIDTVRICTVSDYEIAKSIAKKRSDMDGQSYLVRQHMDSIRNIITPPGDAS